MASNFPRGARGLLDILAEKIKEMVHAVIAAGSRLFTMSLPIVENAWAALRDFATAHPQLTTALAFLALGLLIQPLVGAIVGLLGFGVSGVQAGSIAAQIQSALHGGFVPAGSFFSLLQSFGTKL